MCKKSRKRSNRNVFDPSQSQWSYRAEAADVLRTTQLPISSERFAARQSAATACVTHDSGYWAAAMAGQNFAVEDRLDTAEFNTALWRGLEAARNRAFAMRATLATTSLRALRISTRRRARH